MPSLWLENPSAPLALTPSEHVAGWATSLVAILSVDGQHLTIRTLNTTSAVLGIDS